MLFTSGRRCQKNSNCLLGCMLKAGEHPTTTALQDAEGVSMDDSLAGNLLKGASLEQATLLVLLQVVEVTLHNHMLIQDFSPVWDKVVGFSHYCSLGGRGRKARHKNGHHSATPARPIPLRSWAHLAQYQILNDFLPTLQNLLYCYIWRAGNVSQPLY